MLKKNSNHLYDKSYQKRVHTSEREKQLLSGSRFLLFFLFGLEEPINSN